MSVKGFDPAIARIDAIQRKLTEAPQKAAEEWLEKDFKPAAKALAPVRTGELRDSIDGTVTPHGVRVFADADHARFVEEGTTKMPAQPFLEPAFRQSIGKLQQRIKEALRRVR